MCQRNVYAIDSGREEPLLEEVFRLGIEDDEVTIEPPFVEKASLSARTKAIDLMKNRLVFQGV